MKEKNYIISPVGRLVWGSLYNKRKKNYHKIDLTEDQQNYKFGVALPKTTSDWKQSEWGKQIYQDTVTLYNQKIANSSNFYWKIYDGDSTTPTSGGLIPVEQPGYKNHWIIALKTKFEFKKGRMVKNNQGKSFFEEILEKDFITPGDYVQVRFSINKNSSINTLNLGIFLNPDAVCFNGKGEPIIIRPGTDYSDVGFYEQTVPEASDTPVAATGFGETQQIAPQPTPQSQGGPAPYPDILNVPIYEMTQKAGKHTREQLIALDIGWTDELLISQGLMKRVK